MKQITSFMSEIPDEFKVVVVQAIRSVVSAAFCSLYLLHQLSSRRRIAFEPHVAKCFCTSVFVPHVANVASVFSSANN